MRASLLVEGSNGETAVIDTGPEFRLQAIRAGLRKLDAIFLTHAHADHVHGLDDVRPLSREKPLPVYGCRETIEEMRERFSYVFKETQLGGGKPQLNPVKTEQPVSIGGLVFSPIPVKHGALDILGWRIDEAGGPGRTSPRISGSGHAVYLTDTSAIPPASLPLIGQPETLIIGGLRVRPHETHFSFEEALDAGAALGAKRIFLTHICHDLSHRQIEEYCKNYVERKGIKGITMEPAYDSLEIDTEN
jgi:phosphoribosyl 1,2-cyclic phosphate phosphodiesterase